MKRIGIVCFIILILQGLVIAQDSLRSVRMISTGEKCEAFSVVEMDANLLFVFCGSGYVAVDSTGFPLYYNRYLSTGYENGKIYKAMNGDVLMLVNTDGIGPGSGDVMLFRMHADGSIRWIRVYGTPQAESAAGLVEMVNGDLLIAMTAAGFAGTGTAMVLAAVDSVGNQLWQRAYWTDEGDAIATSISKGSGERIYLSGLAPQGGILLKTSAEGQLIFSRAFADCVLSDVTVSEKNGHVFSCGYRKVASDTMAFMAETDSLGVLQQHYSMGIMGVGMDYSFISIDSSRDLVNMGGRIYRGGAAKWNPVLAQFSSDSGTMTVCEHEGSGDQTYNDFCLAGDDHYMWVGRTDPFDTIHRVSVMTNVTSSQLQAECHVYPLSCVFLTDVIVITDPGLATDTGNLDVVTYCFPPAAGNITYLNMCHPAGQKEHTEVQSLSVFPNPSEGAFTIVLPEALNRTFHVIIYNIIGDIIYRESVVADGRMKAEIDAGLSEGFYHVKVTDGSAEFVAPLIIVQ